MTPHKTSPGGMFRFDRYFAGVGRIVRASGTDDVKEFTRRDHLLTRLYDNGQLDVLKAFKAGQIPIAELVQAARAGALRSDQLLAGVKLQLPLWVTAKAMVQRLGSTEGTRKRYQTSFTALQARSGLGKTATVAELERIDWKALQKDWGRVLDDEAKTWQPGSAADWNHLRRAVSSVLSELLGKQGNAFRDRVLEQFPLAREVPRLVDLSADEFWPLVNAAPAHAQPCIVVLAITGMRVGEYLACTRADLDAAACTIKVPGTKTAGSRAVISVDPDFWPYVVSGVPSPLRYKWLRIQFKRAAAAIKRPELRVHDLRHFYAQIASDAGASTAKVQAALRQSNPGMTRRYELQSDRGEVARLVGGVLKARRGA